MLTHRLALGVVLITLALLLGWLDGAAEALTDIAGLVLAVAAAPALSLGALELAALMKQREVRLGPGITVFAVLSGLAVGAVSALAPNADRAGFLSVPLTAVWLLVTIGAVAARRRTGGATASIAGACLIFILLGVIPSSFLVLRQHESAWTIIALILITKVSDIGAYFVGTAFGRRRLIPWLSPGKTREGLAGGIVASGLAAMIFAMLAQESGPLGVVAFPLSPIPAAVIGGALAIVGLAGDLTISLCKRDAGVKDSSGLIPGMGGALDVMDSLLFIGPAAHWFILLVGRA